MMVRIEDLRQILNAFDQMRRRPEVQHSGYMSIHAPQHFEHSLLGDRLGATCHRGVLTVEKREGVWVLDGIEYCKWV